MGSTHSSVGRALDSWSQGCGFHLYWRSGVVSLSKTLHPHCSVLDKPRKQSQNDWKIVDRCVKQKQNKIYKTVYIILDKVPVELCSAIDQFVFYCNHLLTFEQLHEERCILLMGKERQNHLPFTRQLIRPSIKMCLFAVMRLTHHISPLLKIFIQISDMIFFMFLVFQFDEK